MKTKTENYTPGPWAAEYAGKDTIKVFKTSDKRRVATIKVTVSTRRLDEADSKLISAVPELLEALELLLDMVEGIDGFDPSTGQYGCSAMRFAQYAIEKATGKAVE